MVCAPFFVAVMVGFFFKNEKSGIFFYIGFAVAMAGIIMISMSGQKNLQLNPLGDGLAFLAMISWGCYSALIKKIGEWEYPIVAVTRRVYIYVSSVVTVVLSVLVLHEKMTMASVAGAALIFIGLVISQKKTVSF